MLLLTLFSLAHSTLVLSDARLSLCHAIGVQIVVQVNSSGCNVSPVLQNHVVVTPSIQNPGELRAQVAAAEPFISLAGPACAWRAGRRGCPVQWVGVPLHIPPSRGRSDRVGAFGAYAPGTSDWHIGIVVWSRREVHVHTTGRVDASGRPRPQRLALRLRARLASTR